MGWADKAVQAAAVVFVLDEIRFDSIIDMLADIQQLLYSRGHVLH